MANYINQDILCQAYIHIDPVPIDENEYEEFQALIHEYINTRGKFFLHDSITTDIELKDGSLKVYGTILGAIYLSIAQYGSFRAGVDYLEKDVKRLTEVIISESLFQSKSRHQNIVRVEARIGIIGYLKSIMDNIDLIKSRVGEVEPDEIAIRMTKLTESITKMINQVKSEEDMSYIKENLFLELSEIPRRPIPLPDKPISDSTKILYRESRKKLLLSSK